MTYKIAIVVPGRFHAFDLAKALIARGHEVTIFTNLLQGNIEQLGIPLSRVKSFTLHNIFSKFNSLLQKISVNSILQPWLHSIFGSWAASKLKKENWDLIHSWSGISEEIIRFAKENNIPILLMRGSSHIVVQSKLLMEEESRVGRKIDCPSKWIIDREETEYKLTNGIRILSRFSYNSFIEQGISPDKLYLLPSGVPYERFRPEGRVIDERCQRILNGLPLRVLFVGTLSFRKGLWDLAYIISHLKESNFLFKLVGPQTAEVQSFLKKESILDLCVPKQVQKELPKWYGWGDLFVFPTIEDGFALTVAEAYANALPVLTTTNCCGPDIVHHNKTGWVFPIRSPESFISQLKWCNENRKVLAEMVQHIYSNPLPESSWVSRAIEFEKACELMIKRKSI